MVGRIVRSADFERVLARPPCSRSAHFAAHHLAARPSLAGKPPSDPGENKLSTGTSPTCSPVVDELAPAGCWLGSVVPKRHARRAVTRNLIKREMRAAMMTASCELPQGLWVLRLRTPFDRARFPSAASNALRGVARDELKRLLERCIDPMRLERKTGGASS